ncbi:hypothetical protein Aph01nite_23210 [Acrocarpospora phusangensis]|uniref:N-acetyltransferase domain-containing protein n=1 Tax=Acrocarpospora phusangensis TaxID=1070424 RepID=A0A919Q884_9ACTN|nr:hypothetical protein [Acrocarpospora phusangensis]GIH24011.1 hypothetical protein Aph01nite_23210 [Acrocarpospora phusangensis]
MTTPEITVASPADRARVVRTLVAAFTGDPTLRHLFPDPVSFPRYAAVFFGNLFDKRVHKKTIWTVQGGASVAMWEPPGDGDGLADGYLAAHLPGDVLERVRAYDQAVHAALPAVPFWYLGVLGTHPDSAGRRWGHAVMREGLLRAAAEGLPAVLETGSPGNVEVYRRAGWEVVGTLAEPVPTWIMRRP